MLVVTIQITHIIEMSSTVIKDSLLHNCPQPSRTAWK